MVTNTIGSGGDYADIGAAWAALCAIGTIVNDYTFNIISNFTEVTGVTTSVKCTMNGHSVSFIDSGNHTIICNTGYYFVDNGAAASIADRLIFDGLTIYASTKPGSGLVRLLRVACQFNSNTVSFTVKNCKIYAVNNTGVSGSFYGIMAVVGTNKLSIYNTIIYNCHYGLEMSVNVNATSTGNIIENCTVYNCGNGVDFTYAVSTVAKYCTFNNVVVHNSATTDWYTGGSGPGNYMIFNNCADQDNSLSALAGTKNNCITGIVDADFESLSSTSSDFLKLPKGSISANPVVAPLSGTKPLRVGFRSNAAYTNGGSALADSGIVPTLTSTDRAGHTYGQYGDYPIGCYNSEVA